MGHARLPLTLTDPVSARGYACALMLILYDTVHYKCSSLGKTKQYHARLSARVRLFTESEHAFIQCAPYVHTECASYAYIYKICIFNVSALKEESQLMAVKIKKLPVRTLPPSLTLHSVTF